MAPTLHEWYTDTGSTPRYDDLAASEAYVLAVKSFAADEHAQELINSANGLEDLHDVLTGIASKYESKRNGSKIRRVCVSLTTRLHHYSKVFDVLLSHHPEYTALAWGAMKFLFVGVVNHEKLFTTLGAALSDIGDALSGVQLASALYPTPEMRSRVERLYSILIKFFVRAADWYRESKIRHILHAITQPVELRFQDILDKIKASSKSIDDFAAAASRAEARAMHEKIDTIMNTSVTLASSDQLQDLSQKFDLVLRSGSRSVADPETQRINAKLEAILARMEEYESKAIVRHTVQSGAIVDTSHQISDLQFSQIMSLLQQSPFADQKSALESILNIHRRQLSTRRRSAGDKIWTAPNLKGWGTTDRSAIAILRSTFEHRTLARGICAEIVKQVQSKDIPVIWVFNTATMKADKGKTYVDLLRNLCQQALALNSRLRNERTLSLSCRKFHTASTEQEWFQLLEEALTGIHGLYVIVDTSSLTVSPGNAEVFSLSSAFSKFFQDLEDRGIKVRIKVLLLSFSPSVAENHFSESYKPTLIPLKTAGPASGSRRQPVSRRRGMALASG